MEHLFRHLARIAVLSIMAAIFPASWSDFGRMISAPDLVSKRVLDRGLRLAGKILSVRFMKHCSACHKLYSDRAQTCPEDGTALRVVEDIAPGMILRSKYFILEWVGAGGMASVYRAQHQLLNEERAIKVVLPKFSGDKDFLKRFRHEAAVARKLRHPNAVWVEDLDEIEDGRPFIAMEFLRGRDLRSVIQKEGPLKVERALALASQIASALSAAHELGIVHRDIKPDNILITMGKRGQEVAKVLDFGIAKAKEADPEAVGAAYTPTKTGMIVGTPGYISPEQAMGMSGDKLDGRADIYSLGIVIYEMLTGRLPFESETPMGMLLHHLQTRPLPPHELAPAHVPKSVSMVLMKALEKQPNDRFQTADELVRALHDPSQWETVVVDSARPAAPILDPTVVVSIPAETEYQTAPNPPAIPNLESRVEEALLPENSSSSTAESLKSSDAEAKIGRHQLFSWKLMVFVLAAVGLIAALIWNNYDNAANSGPKQSPDDLLRKNVGDRLRKEFTSARADSMVTVSVTNGIVTLGGMVASNREKVLVETLARGVPGVKDCVNVVEVVDVKASAASQPAAANTTEGATNPKKPSSSVAPGATAVTPSLVAKPLIAGAGTSKISSKDGLAYVWIPPGNFTMGCSPGDNCLTDENPSHNVTITKGFWMGQTLVTQAAYQREMNTNPSYVTALRLPSFAVGRNWNPGDVHVDRLPVEQVSWDDAKAYCAVAGMRLPTEAEWEYAARAGSKTARYGNLNAIAWYDKNSGSIDHEVGQKQPNAWKLYDMLGNVEEWTSDWYDQNYYRHSPSEDPRGPSSGQERVLRGGSWLSYDWFVRLSYRYRAKPDSRSHSVGFRCVGEKVP